MKAQINFFDELIVDSFAGGGGASTGIELAINRPVDIAINHDPAAIAMHKANHPFTRHYCESVWDVNPREATQWRAVALAWFSPDCKHFSKARGGKPADKNIRGLAWVAVSWAETVHPRVIILENVEEFKTWGPLGEDGLPDKKLAGRTFCEFVDALRGYGYEVDWRELKACDYGAPTIRKRFFLIARCDGQPIVWPEPTHAAPESEAVRSGKLKPWRTAAEIINWTIPCPSIFDTAEEIYKKYGVRSQRPLAENTLRRIARGIQKFVIENPEPFIVRVNFSGSEHHYCNSVHEPLNTITGKNGWGIVTPYITSIGQTGFSKDRSRHIDTPLNTTVSKAEQCLITPTLIQYHKERDNNEVRGQLADNPLLTVDGSNRYAVVAAFMSKYYSGGHDGKGNSANEPINTITGIDHNALITSNLVIFRNNSIGQPATEPFNTIMTSPGHFGEVRAFITKYYGGERKGQSLNEPLHTLTTDDRFGLVTVYGEQYVIADIGLRMLTPRELFNAQGFPPDYIIDCDADGKGYSKSAQVARCGNSVPPPFAEALVRANLPELCGKKIESMAELEKEIAI